MTASQDSPVREVRWIERNAIVDAVGDIDLHRSVAFQHAMLGLMDESPRRIVVNLTDVTYMDSSGIATLVKVLSRTRRGGTALVLCGLIERVRSVFEITRLDTVFNIVATEQEALSQPDGNE